MRRLRSLRPMAALAVLAVFASGCNGSRGTGSALPHAPMAPNPWFGSTSFVYDADFVNASQFVKPATFGALGIDVVVKLQNPQGLMQYASQVNNPGSGAYRHFLTPEQIADRYFATASDYAAAIKYLERYGLSVAGWKQRFLLHASGTQAQLERAFGTKFGWYQHRDETFLAPMTAPSVPKSVPIIGSTTIVYRTKRYKPSFGPASNGLLGGYSPQQIQLAFDYAGAYNLNDFGQGVTIGVIGTGPVSLNSGTHLGDLEAMRKLYNAPGTNTITLVPVKGTVGKVVFSQPPPVTKQCSQSSNPHLPPSQSPTATCNPEDGEAQADTEQAALLAPQSNIDFYLAYTSNDGSGFTAQGLPLVGDEVQQALNDNAVDVLSMSFGGDEIKTGPTAIKADEIAFAQAAAQGMSMFASSGDNGAYACQDGLAPPQYFNSKCVSYPATSAYVTAVGGVTTPLNSAGQFIGPVVAWGESTTGGTLGTGGGVSAYVPLPSYQQNCTPPANGGCPVGNTRNVPDISLDADPLTGVAVLMDADPSIGPRTIQPFGGTSVAAPEAAAMWALVVGVCKARLGQGSCGSTGRLGNPNPYLYNIYNGKATQTYALTFFDVLYGTNGQIPGGPTPGPTFLPGYNAGVGYDLTTGIGVPFARALIKAVSGA